MTKNSQKVMLVIMDGWGFTTVHEGNAIHEANTPTFDYLWQNYSHTLLNAFGENVGLQWGAIGSSEIGHSSIGSGLLAHQELSLIDKEISDGGFYKNEKIINLIKKSQQRDIHLIGLVSHGGVHSLLSHLYALLKMIDKSHFNGQVYIHAITDGRDTSPNSASEYLNELNKHIKQIGTNAKIASLIGRFYAMDRDSRWERTKKAYDLFANAVGKKYVSIESALKENYGHNKSDEFFEPSLINLNNKNFFSRLIRNDSPRYFNGIKEGDGVIFFNTRPDRMRQLVETFLFKKSIENKLIKNINVLTLTTYDQYLPIEVAYPSKNVESPLAKILSDNGLSQGHFAETEKYAHVTYFFNGGNPEPYKHEYWELVPSPKVDSYDKSPSMSAEKVTKRVLDLARDKNLDFIVINYANADMVGHTGNYKAVIQAIETVDKQLKTLTEHFNKWSILITADHGNAECMIHQKTGEIDKRHTVNPVPFIVVDDKFKKYYENPDDVSPTGILADIAPTILKLFRLKPASAMNGVDLSHSLSPNNPHGIENRQKQ